MGGQRTGVDVRHGSWIGRCVRATSQRQRGHSTVLATQQTEIRVNALLTTMSASADGRFLVFTVEAAARAQSDLWVLSRANKTAAPLVQQDFNQTQGTISPDGQWLAYVSNESGVNEVFLRPLSDDGGMRSPSLGRNSRVSGRGDRAALARRQS